MDFPSNSQNPKGKPEAPDEKPRVEKVVKGPVIQKKKPIGERIRGIFARGEFKQAISFVTVDVMIPAIRDLVVDATSKGIERLVYGDTRPRRARGHGAATTTLVSYNDPVNRYSASQHPAMLPKQPPRGGLPSRSRAQGDILLVDKDDAQATLDMLCTLVEQYEVASVADLNDMLGLPATYVDNSWGWTNLAGSRIVQTREGYLLQLPPIEQL